MLANSADLTIEEELFCTRYELEILSGIVNLNMLERWVPGFCGAHTHKEHVNRYNWVKGLVENKAVLDIACGTGYGSFILATDGRAASVTACDIDSKTVKYASCRNRNPVIDFQVQNAEQFNFDIKFDVVISFETIEHLKKPEAFLKNVQEVLDVNGAFIVSTPISKLAQNDNPVNIYHAVEWGFERFQELVSKYFSIENVLLQVYGMPPRPDNRFVARHLRKAGISRRSQGPVVEKLTPFVWNPAEISKETIGSVWSGYQVLQCKKKEQ